MCVLSSNMTTSVPTQTWRASKEVTGALYASTLVVTCDHIPMLTFLNFTDRKALVEPSVPSLEAYPHCDHTSPGKCVCLMIVGVSEQYVGMQIM
jgi:hypothetical protein